MKDILNISEKTIRSRANDNSYQRGYSYYKNGEVLSVKQRGNQIIAEVQGSEYNPYTVSISLDNQGIDYAECSCPYDMGGDCKHIIAVLLTCVHSPQNINEQPSVNELISDLDRDQLHKLVLDLAQSHPEIIDSIEAQVLEKKSDIIVFTKGQQVQQIDKESFKKQVRLLMRSNSRRDSYNEYNDSTSGELDKLVVKVRSFIEAGDGNNAILMLDGITDGYMEEWSEIEWFDDEYDTSFFDQLGNLWMEAILNADLTPSEREELAVMLDSWATEIDDYDVNDSFGPAKDAVEQGWDYPPLKRILEGNTTDSDIWEEYPWYADDMIIARLKVLARKGRTQEYLNLSKAEEMFEYYASMQVQLGNIQEAMDFGLEHINSGDKMLIFAKSLHDRGKTELALQSGEKGLELEGDHRKLAKWMRDLALESKQPDKALKAVVKLIHEEPTLEDYRLAEKLSGDNWQALQEKLLNYLRQSKNLYGASNKIDIFLYEELVDDAIKALGSYFYYGTAEKVLNAAINVRPNWVITTCSKQAEAIMDAGQANKYEHAIPWLEKAKEAYTASNKQSEWAEYLNSLFVKHKKKTKLMPMLKGLA